MKTYLKDECAWFYSSKDPFFEFSNMSSGFPVYYKGRKWMSTEHLYQASKYHEDAECIPATAKDPNTIANVRERIFHAKNCMAAKMTQKCAVAKGLVREDWSTQSIDNMRFVLELKLLAHPKVISDALKRSGERPIVEISRKDTFWGCEQRYSQKGTLLVGNNNPHIELSVNETVLTSNLIELF